MRQCQLFRVQRDAGNQRPLLRVRLEPVIWFQSRKPERFAAIKFIADDGQTGVAQVDANLVGAVGERLGNGATSSRRIFQALQKPFASVCRFSGQPASGRS